MSASAGRARPDAVRVDDSGGNSLVAVHVSPGARRTRVAGVYGDALKIAVSAPPADGRANAALVELIAETVGVRKSAVAVVAGQTSRRKRVCIQGVPADVVRQKLTAALPPAQQNTEKGTCREERDAP